MCGLVNIGSGSVNKWTRAQSEEFALSKNTTVPSADSTGDTNGYFAVVAGRAYSTYSLFFLPHFSCNSEIKILIKKKGEK